MAILNKMNWTSVTQPFKRRVCARSKDEWATNIYQEKKNNNEMKNNNKTKKHKLKKKQTNKPDIGALTKFGIMLNVQVY